MKGNSQFRNWVRKIWLENSEERQTYRDLPYTMQEYWARYKYWLKREYQYQQGQNESTTTR